VSFRSTSLLVLFAGTALLLAGCREDALVTNLKSDDAFIRLPGQVDTDITPHPGTPFPLAKGSQWEMLVETGSQQAAEIDRASGSTVIGGVNGQAIETMQDGKAVREDVYGSDEKGVTLIAAGAPADQMRISPPITLFTIPLHDGDVFNWSGILHFRTSSSPATALSRVRGRDRITTPAGAFDTFRVDTIIMTTVDGQTAAFPTTRWIAPGVGVVKQRLLAGRTVITKFLKSYTPAKN
jgi:hypothetical protein